MQTYIALLRGINVGGNSKVEMPKLKKVFESLGHTDVVTYINSGNVIFKSDKKESALCDAIEKAIHKQFKFPVKVLIRSAKNIIKVAKVIPKEWVNNSDEKTDVLFLWEEFDNKKSLLLLNAKGVDNLMYVSGAIVWNVKKKDYTKSAMTKFIGSKLYKGMTARNVNTVRKLAIMVG